MARFQEKQKCRSLEVSSDDQANLPRSPIGGSVVARAEQEKSNSLESHARMVRRGMEELSKILNEMEKNGLHGEFGVIMVAREGRVFEIKPISLPTFRDCP